MDLNREYAAHQRALMRAGDVLSDRDRLARLEKASGIAGRISVYQHSLGAAAACAWSNAQIKASAASRKG